MRGSAGGNPEMRARPEIRERILCAKLAGGHGSEKQPAPVPEPFGVQCQTQLCKANIDASADDCLFAALIAHHDFSEFSSVLLSTSAYLRFCPENRHVPSVEIHWTESPERIQEPRIDGWAFDELVLFIQYKVVVDDGSEQLSVSILPVPSPENKMSPFDSLRVGKRLKA